MIARPGPQDIFLIQQKISQDKGVIDAIQQQTNRPA
jgi:hypothetical protein